MKKMIKEDLAFADLQEFGLEFSNKLKSIKLGNKTLYRKVSGTAMKVKLVDEQQLRRELIKVKTKMKKILSEKFEGDRTRQYRRVINNLNKMAREKKHQMNEKYNKKIEHLRHKYKNTENDEDDVVPEDLEEYADLSVFKKIKYEKINPVPDDVKVIGEVDLREEEKKVLKLHTKFSILEDLTKGGFDG